MKIDTKELTSAFSNLTKIPYLTATLFALAVPIFFLYGATKYVAAPFKSLVVFGFLGVLNLVYSAWVFASFIGKTTSGCRNNT